MPTVRLACGRRGLTATLPDEGVTVIESRYVSGLPDEAAAIRQALRSPIGSLPLVELVRPTDTVAVVFSDITRPMPNDRVLPVLLEELAWAGVPDHHVLLINALATHRPQTEAELRRMLGDGIVDRYRILQHNGWNDAMLVPVATRRFRLRFSTGRASTSTPTA
ncbi:MAG: lactate racemase domain-containing protein [Anaerolineae bacterium]